MKKYLFGSFAIALAVAFSAFTVPVKSASEVRVYNPALGGITNINAWVVSGSETPCSETSGLICKVVFTPSENFANFADFLVGRTQATILSAPEISSPTYQVE